MARRKTFLKEEILKSSFEFAKKNGLECMTARRISKHMNASTIIIYSNFSDLETLKKEMVTKSFELLKQYVQEPYTERELFNLGIGFVFFAREYPNLFNDLFVYKTRYKELFEELHVEFVKRFKKDKTFETLTEKKLKEVGEILRIIHFGLASLISVGQFEGMEKDAIVKILEKLVFPTVQEFVVKEGRTAKDTKTAKDIKAVKDTKKKK